MQTRAFSIDDVSLSLCLSLSLSLTLGLSQQIILEHATMQTMHTPCS